MNDEKLQQTIQAHENRNAALRRLFLEKNVDTCTARDIDFHFWTQGQANAAALAESLGRLGFEVPVQGPAVNRDDLDVWNIEARIRQSIDLTIRREFIADVVKLADSHGGVFDGWGTLL